jgi:hypothetical protein
MRRVARRHGRVTVGADLGVCIRLCAGRLFIKYMSDKYADQPGALNEVPPGSRFAALMDQAMPQWRLHRKELNRFPLSHEDWSY